MPRSPSRLLLPAVAFVALVFLSPSIATAFPKDATLHSGEHSSATPGLFAKLWDLLSVAWMIGSVLEPDGVNADPSTDPAAAAGGSGSALEPDGR